MYVSYKYRVYPNAEQVKLLESTFGCVRFVWNKAVEAFNTYDKETNPKPKDINTTELRNEYVWMQSVSAAVLQQKHMDFKEFKSQYFSKNRKSKIGKCSFKNKNQNQSFRLPNQKFTLRQHKIRLEKIGWVDAVIDRHPPKCCRYISVTVSRNKVNQYFASVLVEETKTELPKTGRSVGIDLGLSHFIIDSYGNKVENPRLFRENQAKLKKLQRSLSRKKKGSSRFKINKLKVAKLHLKIANKRRWFHHQVANRLIKDFDNIVIESLNIKGMVKNRKLAKSISDAGWSQFVSILEYKANWYGKILTKIDRFFPSSKTCSSCGWHNKDLKLSDREFICQNCGAVHDRDVNAANNILKAGGVTPAIPTPSPNKTTQVAQGNEALNK